MKDIIGILAILLIGIVLYLISLPGLANYDLNCPDSHPVIVNSEFMGCLSDKYGPDFPLWTPSGKPAKLQNCEYCEIDHD